jgi:predicted AlkP superfamily pyrophosphatase or phosphodiesterase
MTAEKTDPPISLLDIAPTVALALRLKLPRADGRPVDHVADWGCKKVTLIIIDSLGYELLLWLLPSLENISALCKSGLLLSARAVSSHTTPSIASILSGLLPVHHKIFDKAGAKESSISNIPEMAAKSGLKCAVIMEQNGADVYRGLIDWVHGISDSIPPQDFDKEACRMTCKALSLCPDLLVTYFIGIDKSVHIGKGPEGIRSAALLIDRCIGEIIKATHHETLFVLCGDHPIHAGPLKRCKEPYHVAVILARGGIENRIPAIFR